MYSWLCIMYSLRNSIVFHRIFSEALNETNILSCYKNRDFLFPATCHLEICIFCIFLEATPTATRWSIGTAWLILTFYFLKHILCTLNIARCFHHHLFKFRLDDNQKVISYAIYILLVTLLMFLWFHQDSMYIYIYI